MIVEVVGGAEERPEARVVDIDNLTSVHLALGEVTDEDAAEVLERVREAPASADELARAAGLEAGRAAVLLTELELAGAVVEEDGVYRASR